MPINVLQLKLKTPSQTQLDRAIRWVTNRTPERFWGYFLISTSRDLPGEYCSKHIDKVLLRKRSYSCSLATDETDTSRWCAYKNCTTRLWACLTEEGVNSALALTEENPLEFPVDIDDLCEASSAMVPTDPRWALWYHHYKKLKRSHNL